MGRRKQEKILQISLVIATLVMTILRFLLNEKGRVTPDSIRFMRFADALPTVDNTTTPMGYPLGIKLVTIFGLDEFWSSKLLGILAYSFIVFFAWRTKFYLKEVIFTCALFSFVSIFSFTLSEALILPVVFWLLYVGRQIIIQEYKGLQGFLLLTTALILLFNIRYNSVFFAGAVFLVGILNYTKKYGRTFIAASIAGFVFVVLYKLTVIDYFNEKYVDTFLEIGLTPTSQLIFELFQGLTTAFNPFIHIANPAGGIMNLGIYGLGIINILVMGFLFYRNGLSESEKFFVHTGITGILCSFFIQYFYSTDALDYRLLSPFTFPIWLVYFKKIWQVFGRVTYLVPVLSLFTGVIFIWLARGNYLENRRTATKFLSEEKLINEPILFYIKDEKNLNEGQLAELISTVNPKLEITEQPKDTMKKNGLTMHKVLSKIKIDENSFQ